MKNQKPKYFDPVRFPFIGLYEEEAKGAYGKVIAAMSQSLVAIIHSEPSNQKAA